MDGALPLTVWISTFQTSVGLLSRSLLGKWVVYFYKLSLSRLHRSLIRVAPLDIEELEWIC